MAWKAFLLVASAEEEGQEEGEAARCRRSLELSCEYAPDVMHKPLIAFIDALQGFLDCGAPVVADWFLSPEARESARKAQADRDLAKRLRSIKALGKTVPGLPLARLAGVADEVGVLAYCIRNAVIGHAAVMTGGRLFVDVMPAFEDLVASAALTGWARRAHISPSAAKEFVYGAEI